ncbi:hypothetical protein V2O64_24025 [Verrucomicrobiaceae bacterium 227]
MITSSVLACATCASAFKHGGQDAAGWSIAVMLMVILPLISGVLWAMIRIAKREKADLDPRYCDDYVAPATHS